MDDKKVRLAEAMLRDTKNYPFVNDVIFPPEKIRELRPPHA